MISNAFKGAYQNEVSQQQQGINTISSGVKSAVGAVGLALTAGSSIGQQAIKGLGSRLFGIGGEAVMSVLQEKTTTAQANSETKTLFSKSEVMGTNTIDKKELSTVFEMLTNKNGNFDTDIGEVDPDSPLGKKIKEGLSHDNDK